MPASVSFPIQAPVDVTDDGFLNIELESKTHLYFNPDSMATYTITEEGVRHDYDWLMRKYLAPGGRLDRLIPLPLDELNRLVIASAIYSELENPQMRSKYENFRNDAVLRTNLAQREWRAIYFLKYLCILDKSESQRGVFVRTGKTIDDLKRERDSYFEKKVASTTGENGKRASKSGNGSSPVSKPGKLTIANRSEALLLLADFLREQATQARAQADQYARFAEVVARLIS